MTKDEITQWALANGWQMIDGFPNQTKTKKENTTKTQTKNKQMIDGAPSLTKPAAPHPAIVRLVLKATVAAVEIKKPAGKWEKVSGESYA